MLREEDGNALGSDEIHVALVGSADESADESDSHGDAIALARREITGVRPRSAPHLASASPVDDRHGVRANREDRMNRGNR